MRHATNCFCNCAKSADIRIFQGLWFLASLENIYSHKDFLCPLVYSQYQTYVCRFEMNSDEFLDMRGGLMAPNTKGSLSWKKYSLGSNFRRLCQKYGLLPSRYSVQKQTLRMEKIEKRITKIYVCPTKYPPLKSANTDANSIVFGHLMSYIESKVELG